MNAAQKRLQAIHDDTTRLMAEAKMASTTRKRIATIANKLSELIPQLEGIVDPAQPAQETLDKQTRCTLIKKAMLVLASIARFLACLYDTRWKDDDP